MATRRRTPCLSLIGECPSLTRNGRWGLSACGRSSLGKVARIFDLGRLSGLARV
jgi:hypothetical protein